MEACYACNGSGIFRGGGSVINGVYKGFEGVCFRCQGKGYQTRDDEKRNWGYDNFHRRISL